MAAPTYKQPEESEKTVVDRHRVTGRREADQPPTSVVGYSVASATLSYHDS